MTEQLKPCPFCGGEAWLVTDSVKREVSISCCRCPVLFHRTAYLLDFYKLKSLAIKAWNLRVNESEVQVQSIERYIQIINKCAQESADSLAKLNDTVKQLRAKHD